MEMDHKKYKAERREQGARRSVNVHEFSFV
jgi:hypothetical protein